ncbi:MAG: class I SAM-dependent methyltransferase [Pirellulaceae bacterium]
MFPTDQYELLDFGQGRKLERFGEVVIDRPAPVVAGMAMSNPALWKSADARFTRHDAAHGSWMLRGPLPTCWYIRHGSCLLELRTSDSGAVGVFPEQAENWDWIEQQARGRSEVLRVLNLFAYTGGSTLAAAAAGATVVHVDAARPVVNWARRNAVLSRLSDAPIRWIVEDVRKFVDRELRRGHQYDAVILDPPSYGHGPQAEPWMILPHLGDLLSACQQLTRRRGAFMLLTCHAPAIGPAELAALVTGAVALEDARDVESRRLTIHARDGRLLPSGVMARWSGR